MAKRGAWSIGSSAGPMSLSSVAGDMVNLLGSKINSLGCQICSWRDLTGPIGADETIACSPVACAASVPGCAPVPGDRSRNRRYVEPLVTPDRSDGSRESRRGPSLADREDHDRCTRRVGADP